MSRAEANDLLSRVREGEYAPLYLVNQALIATGDLLNDHLQTTADMDSMGNKK